jgi:twinkle protein
LYNCHNGCGFKGSAAVYSKPKKEYTKPLPRLEKVSEKILKFFESRGISNNTLLRFGITEANEWMPQFEKETQVICFNYFRNEELTNIKFRGANKAFKLAKDAELIFYNLDAIKDDTTAVIVEGEIDCLTMYECGIHNAVSVPNGANKGSQKLEYLDNCWQYFENKTKIILAVDGDEAGNSLKEELARRLGKDICCLVNYPEGCKDANEVLLKYGKEAVIGLINYATLYPLEGEMTIEDMGNELIDYFKNGYPPGCAAGIPTFDEYLTFVPGQLTMVTGIPGSGKDEFVNYITTGLAINHEWKTGVIGFEEPPQVTVTKIIEKYAGKSFGFRKDPTQRITETEFEKGLLFVDNYFKFINTDEIDVTIEGIIEKSKQLVKRYGINCLVISPWNCLEHNIERGESETSYISRVLGKLLSFIKKYGLHCFLIAHPTKLQKDKNTKKYEVPTLYNISGSAHFFNKTHNGISIYRDFESNVVDIYVQKVKWSWLGKLGFCTFRFDTYTRQYISM